MKRVQATILIGCVAALLPLTLPSGVRASTSSSGGTVVVASGGPYMTDRDPCKSVPYGQPVVTGATWAANLGIPLTAPDGATLDVFSNWNGSTCVRGSAPTDVSTPWGEGYQCTQLAMRAADVEWHEGTASAWWQAGTRGGAYSMYDAAPHLPIPLQVVPNGAGALPSPGDILIWNATPVYTGGHAAVVSSVDTVNHIVWFVSQNSSYALYGMPYVGTTLDPAQNFGLPLRGWITKPVPGRGVAVQSGGTKGYNVDGFGGVHPFGGANAVSTTASWPGWDIARGIALRADGASGYVLDGFGGLHPFGGAPGVTVSAFWSGWDIARGLVLRSDGTSGYVLDAFGGLHPFGGAPAVTVSAYWPGWDIARGIVLRSDGVSGYVLDGFGGLHPFGGAPAVRSTGYWSGWDIARGAALDASGDAGWVLDGFGGLHPFGGAAAATGGPYTAGFDVARGLAVDAQSGRGAEVNRWDVVGGFSAASATS